MDELVERLGQMAHSHRHLATICDAKRLIDQHNHHADTCERAKARILTLEAENERLRKEVIEQCAKVAENQHRHWHPEMTRSLQDCCQDIASAIRSIGREGAGKEQGDCRCRGTVATHEPISGEG